LLNLDLRPVAYREQNLDDSIPDPGAGAYTEITVRIPDELPGSSAPAARSNAGN